MSHPRLASSLPEANRHNFYHVIHKALRLGHCHILAALGAHDFTREVESRELMRRLRELIGFGRVYLEAETRYIHAALERRKPGASIRAAAHHRGNRQSFAEIESLMRAVEVAIASRRPLAGEALYRRYALFAATDMEHMHEEETELLATLHANFTDDELIEIEDRIIGTIAHSQMTTYVALMASALNHAERARMLAKLKLAMPDMAFSEVPFGAIQTAASIQ